jgi:subfamily B ATP-binding cassette protein MsbA
MTELRVVKLLTPVLRRHAGALGAVVALGSMVALSEGVGIGLFVPVFADLNRSGALTGEHFPVLLGSMEALAPDSRLTFVLLAAAALVALRSAFVFLHGACLARLTSRLAHELRTRAFAQILAVDERHLEDAQRGALLHVVENQTWETSAAVGTLAAIVTRACKVAVFTLALVCISPVRTLAVVAALALVSVIVRRLGRRVARLSERETRAWERMAQRIAETLTAMRTVRAFGREAWEQERFAADSRTERRTFAHLQLLQAAVGPIAEVLVIVVMLGVLGVALRVPGSLPEALAFLVILYRLHPQLEQLHGGWLSLAAASAPVASVMGLLDVRDKRYVRSGSLVFTGLREEITFHGVSFRYREDDLAAALDRVGLSIPRHGTTAIVGSSGAGKSTIIRLLLRTFDPTEGRLEVDGTPLTAFDVASWRARIAVVTQDAHLFDATVAENVAYGALGAATRDEIRAAVRHADAEAFVEALPQGYDTRLGDDGVRLSAGQRQRLALARALVRNPEILILDEATNAVDPISAEIIHHTLRVLSHERTVILVTHRLSAVEAADQIVLLDHGHVAEAGDVLDLLRRKGSFARLHAAHRRSRLPGAAR